jgi:membrane protein
MKIFMNFFRLLKETFVQWNADGGPRLSAALAYYTAFSIAPLLVVLITTVGFFFNKEDIQTQVIRQIEVTISPDAGGIINELMTNITQPTQTIFSSILSIAALVVGSLGVFENLQSSLDIMWNVHEPSRQRSWRRFLLDKLLSFGMILVVGFLLLVSLVITTVMSFLDSYFASLLATELHVLQILNFIISFALITALFMLIYKFLPHAEVQWRDVAVGAIITALLFTLGKFALAWYLANSSVTSIYGAAGTFAIILLWVYYSAQIVLFGAEFTQVFAKHYGSQITARKSRMKTRAMPPLAE